VAWPGATFQPAGRPGGARAALRGRLQPGRGGGTYLRCGRFDSMSRMPFFRPLLCPRGVRSAWLLVCAAALGCQLGGAEAEVEGPPPVSVEMQRVEAQPLRDVATFNGQLDAEHSVLIRSEADGVVEEVLFDEGQQVEEGVVLFRLKSDEERARLREAEANLALAREVYARMHKLAKRDAASLAANDQAAAELAVARARVELAQVELDRMEVRAPFAGVLGLRRVSVGDRVTDELPLVQIDSVDRLQVSFSISELGILFTRVGAPVEVRVAPYPGETFRGEIFFVSPTLDPATRRILAKAWVPNPDRRLRAGLFAHVDMEVAQRENAILVPESAVVFDRSGTYVWKVKDGVATRVPVEVGLRKDGKVEVTLGLQPGDRIVTAGTHKVKEGGKVVAAGPGVSKLGQARRERGGAGAEEGT
jgi:membrane fusion protein (multidrug efflux system)